eukprot:1273363-Amphidinium_carterae.1
MELHAEDLNVAMPQAGHVDLSIRSAGQAHVWVAQWKVVGDHPTLELGSDGGDSIGRGLVWQQAVQPVSAPNQLDGAPELLPWQ